MSLESIRKVLATAPQRVGLFSDLDGTLAEIVDDPDVVVPVEGATERLAQLATRLGIVSVVSGRPVSFLERFFAPPIELSGLYGLEHRADGRLFVDSSALAWLPVMSMTADRAREEFGLEAVEDKRYSLTVHYRGADEAMATSVTEWAGHIAEETGLDARVAKMSVELHPPTARSKGDAVHDMLTGIDAAIYLGDDVGDLPAFDRLSSLRADGSLSAHAIVLVESHETPPRMHELATDVVQGPKAVLGVLDGLLEAVDSGR